MSKRGSRAGRMVTVGDLTKSQYKRFVAWVRYDVPIHFANGGASFDVHGVAAEKSFPVREYARIVGVGTATARRDLNKFRDAGLMEIANVSAWRKNARRYYYGWTRDGLCVAILTARMSEEGL